MLDRPNIGDVLKLNDEQSLDHWRDFQVVRVFESGRHTFVECVKPSKVWEGGRGHYTFALSQMMKPE